MMTPSGSTVLLRWNSLDAETAAREILHCCGSRAWAEGMAAQRPFASAQQLLAASDAVWATLDEPAWREAFAAHPRIGQRHAPAATAQSLAWSSEEQRAAAAPDAAARLALAEGNRQYEERFGRIFIVCAAGRSAAEISRHPATPHAEHGCRRAARGSRTAAPDYAASPSPLAGSELTMGISTHILDTALGCPATGVPLRLSHWQHDVWLPLAEHQTDADGRCVQLLPMGATLGSRPLPHSFRYRRLLRDAPDRRPLPLRGDRV